MTDEKNTILDEENIEDEQQTQENESTPEQRQANEKASKQRLSDKLASQAAKIAELESKLVPDVKEGESNADDRIAKLETRLARKEAQADYNLSKEAMVLLTGKTPEEIEAQAKYLVTLGQSGDSTENKDENTEDGTNSETSDPSTELNQTGSGTKPELKTYEGDDDTEKALRELSASFKKQLGQ